MNLQKFISKEKVTHLAFGVGGGLSTVPLKKFALSKIPVIQNKEWYQDLACVIGGIAIGAFAKNPNVKTFGLGMSLTGGFNLARPLLSKAGIGSIPDGRGVFMQGYDETPINPVMMGNTDGTDYPNFSTAGDATGGESGEMDF